MVKMVELYEIYFKAKAIMESTQHDWEEKYDLIFSKEISGRVYDLKTGSGVWYDPDTTYQEDTEAFFRQFKEYVEAL
jgi:hypothetical protein